MEYLFQSFQACFGGEFLESIATLTPLNALFGQSIVTVGAKHYQILQQIGEGGYSFVYRICDVETRQEYALKKIMIGGPEQLELAQKEVSTLRSLKHENLLPLLDSSLEKCQDPDSVSEQVLYLLFPLYKGSLFDEVTKRAESSRSVPPRDILYTFLQVCHGVQAMHANSPPLAHRDIKPQNVLLKEIHDDLLAGEDDENHSQLLSGGSGWKTFQAVLTDFGSTREARIHVTSRSEAIKVQEDAEVHCSAPYRAPELFDVESHCQIDERIDVWSLGCLLYFCVYAVSPFEREVGASLALAVQNGDLRWPAEDSTPSGLKDLIQFCLVLDPQQRPKIEDVIDQTRSLLMECQ